MKTLFKILTLPIWLPLKILWFASKVFALCFLILIMAVALYLALHLL